jgi:NitT/TauT family transport system substrate-binding protein
VTSRPGTIRNTRWKPEWRCQMSIVSSRSMSLPQLATIVRWNWRLSSETEWMAQNKESVQVLLEEVLKVWRSIADDPSFVADERERLGLAKDMPAELEEELVPYYEEGAAGGLFTQDCGGEAAVRDDFEFYHAAGQLEGDPSELQVEDFWDLAPAQAALSAVEESGN